jgi:hypothetical protein
VNGPGGGLVANSKRAQSTPQKVWTFGLKTFCKMFYPGNGLVTVMYELTDLVYIL